MTTGGSGWPGQEDGLTRVLLARAVASCAPLEQQSSLLCSQLFLAEEK